MHKYLLFLLLAAPLPLLAAEPAEPDHLEPLPEIPPPAIAEPVTPPPTGLEDEALEPEVRIIKRDDAIVYEYRVNNRLYKVKVVPRVGLPYYLIDRDGDGTMETRSDELDPVPFIPNWVLYSW